SKIPNRSANCQVKTGNPRKRLFQRLQHSDLIAAKLFFAMNAVRPYFFRKNFFGHDVKSVSFKKSDFIRKSHQLRYAALAGFLFQHVHNALADPLTLILRKDAERTDLHQIAAELK